MGYTTDFNGSFELNRPATAKELDYINKFADSRRMKRSPHRLFELYSGKHGHPTPKDNSPVSIYGKDGAYFNLEDNSYHRDDKDKSFVDHNTPPGQISYEDSEYDSNERWIENQRRIATSECQPGLWCQWELNEDGTELEWDGNEKFYNYTEWLKYLIIHFFEPWGIKLNGEVEWQGEEPGDIGKIVVTDNVVEEKIGRVVYD